MSEENNILDVSKKKAHLVLQGVTLFETDVKDELVLVHSAPHSAPAIFIVFNSSAEKLWVYMENFEKPIVFNEDVRIQTTKDRVLAMLQKDFSSNEELYESLTNATEGAWEPAAAVLIRKIVSIFTNKTKASLYRNDSNEIIKELADKVVGDWKDMKVRVVPNIPFYVDLGMSV